ncbi:PxKF domain-containing protein [Pseudomonas sp.]|uniref:PxKF domain-containing protein n=1 Tax=Pseudomonas sp. TaxID=306 RepID=UPI0027346D41|nr:PxKF domain-containing protein [Pseudomonas sp.]MDP3816249.1 PxKF domain-containing protein [Pseudomonas sp.]
MNAILKTISRDLVAGAVLAAGLASGIAHADVFIKGDYVEAGIHDAASFGSALCAPPEFHSSRVTCGLGFIADFEKNGWTVGTPDYAGDYFLPGSPYEGWVVEWTNPTGTERQFTNAGAIGHFEIPLIGQSTPAAGMADWAGRKTLGDEQLDVQQKVTIPADKGFMLVEVTLTNTGTVPMTSVEYLRGVDPDQGIPTGGFFDTLNWVEFQSPRPAGARPALAAIPAGNTNKVLAMSEETGYGITLGLGTVDTRAVAASGVGWPIVDADRDLNSPYQPTPASPQHADAAMSLSFDLGNLAPGESTTLKFAYVHSIDDLADAFAALAPTLDGLADQILEATNPAGAVATYTVTANDPEDGAIAATCTPASGSTFPLGSTTVGCEATDSDANLTSGSFTVTVVDTTPPTLSLPTDIAAEATGPSGSMVSYTATASDLVSGSVPVTCTPVSGSTFALGTTPVSCSVSDAAGNSASGGFSVTVVDTTAPEMTCPANVTGVPGQTVDLGEATVSDAVDATPTLSNNAPTSFPPGVTTVMWTATDDSANSATCTQTVTLRYTFQGFFQPVDNLPVLNSVKNGSTVPVKWRLLDANGAYVTDTATVAGIDYISVSCVGGEDAVEQVATSTGGTELRWDSTSSQFIYNWKTPALRGQCLRLNVQFNDGATLSANFKLK